MEYRRLRNSPVVFTHPALLRTKWGVLHSDKVLNQLQVHELLKPSMKQVKVKKLWSDDMERKVIVIDGEKFSDLKGFYAEAGRVMSKNNGTPLNNLGAFNDLLWGGFGVFEYGEPIELVWKNSEKSKKELGKKPHTNRESFFDILVGIIQEHSRIDLRME